MSDEEDQDPKERFKQEENERMESGSPWLRPVRKHLRKVWLDGGGGYYGLGYLCMFVWLELNMIAEDVVEIVEVFQSPDAGSIVGTILGQIFAAFIETLVNALLSGLWPFLMMGDIGFWSALGVLMVTYFLYHNFLRDPLGEWLGFDLTVDDDDEDSDDTPGALSSSHDQSPHDQSPHDQSDDDPPDEQNQDGPDNRD
ncbi:MAG: hypothetical protein AAF525_01375 [Pseudomonadota bacterium]